MVGKADKIVEEVTTDTKGSARVNQMQKVSAKKRTDGEVSEMMSKITESNILELRKVKIAYLRHQIAEIESGNDDKNLLSEIEIAITEYLDPRAKYAVNSK